MIYFDSDYMAGAHPAILERLQQTNLERTVGYGADEYTSRAADRIREACRCSQAEVYFLVGGTQTNATVIDGLLARHQGVLAPESGHINVHEAGAIEAAGHKVLVLPSHQGKVTAAQVKDYVDTFYQDDTYPHMVAPGMLYISFPTEYGTMYSLQELEELSGVCRQAGIPLYADGARLAYALAAPGNDVTLPDLARLCDVFYIGGTKAGTLFGEAVVVTRPGLLKHFFSLVKQHGALLAKGRLLGLQFDTLFTDGLYQQIGAHAVGLALKIRQAFEQAGYPAVVDSVTNQQFFCLPNGLVDRLRESVSFEYWGPRGEQESVIRIVTSWSTTQEEVNQLVKMLQSE